MLRRVLTSLLATTAAAALVLLALGGSESAGAHTSPLDGVASAANSLASTIAVNGAVTEPQIVALGMAGMAVSADAPSHPECPTMRTLGANAVSTYESLHGLYVAGASPATYAPYLAGLQSIAAEAEQLSAQKSNPGVTPSPEPSPVPTPRDEPEPSGTPDVPATGTPGTPPPTPPANPPRQTPPPAPPSSGTGAPSAAATGHGVAPHEHGTPAVWLIGLAVLGGALGIGGRLATARRRA